MSVEEPSARPPSKTTRKLEKAELEKELDEITTDSDFTDMGPEGKTMKEIDAVIAEYHQNVRDSRLQTVLQRRALESNAFFLACQTYVLTWAASQMAQLCPGVINTIVST